MEKEILIFVLIIAIIGTVAIFLFNDEQPSNEPSQSTKENVAQKQETEDIENMSNTENYADRGDHFENRDTGTAAFAPVACPQPKTHNGMHYDGMLIDSHFHPPRTEYRVFDTITETFIPDPEESDDPSRPPVMGIDVTIPEIACLFAYEGTQKAFMFFGIATEREERMIGVARKQDQVEVVRKAMEIFPDRFVPFIGIPDEPSGFPTVDANELESTLNIMPHLFAGYGEIGLYPSEGVPPLPPNSERLRAIYPVVREHGLVVYFHLGEGQKESFRQALRDNPDINFVFHGDQLIEDVFEDGRQDLSQIEEIISNHRNAFYTVDELYGDVFLLRPEVSKEEFLTHFQDYEPLLEKDLASWKRIIEKYPDQFMWGTDRGGGWTFDREVGWTLADYGRAFIARLDTAVQEKFAYQNAERLFSQR